MDLNPDAASDLLPPEDVQPPQRHAGLIAWIASGSLHATMLMLMGTAYFLVVDPEQDTPPLNYRAIPPPRALVEEKQPKDRSLDPPTEDMLIDATAEAVPVAITELPPEALATEDLAEVAAPVPSTETAALAMADMSGPGVFLTIGPGASTVGLFKNRTPIGRKNTARKDGTPAPENAVEAALRWFKRHQSPNGMWDAEALFPELYGSSEVRAGLIGELRRRSGERGDDRLRPQGLFGGRL